MFLPAWSKAAKIAIQPSSAAAERTFSLLYASFGVCQASTLEDYLEAATMQLTLVTFFLHTLCIASFRKF